jgi:hypothetical protein
MKTIGVGLALALVVCGAPSARAQATRTWVSGVGDDVNPCSRTAPCKTFAGAISKTAAGGEINAIDSGGFGAVTITKAITIDGGGVLAGILAAGTNGVNVNAGVNDRVVLRNLSINGVGTGLNGVRFLAGKSVHVENCTISGFTTTGIDVDAAGDLFVGDTSIRRITGTGIVLAPATGTAQAVLDGVRVEGTGTGVAAQGSVRATARGTSVAGTDVGFSADGPDVELNLDGVVASHNQTGIQATGGARVRLKGATVVDNAVAGVSHDEASSVTTFTDNQVAGNPPGGAACELPPSSAVGCPAADLTCEAPIVQPQAGMGTCKRCRTKQGVTTCTSCTIAVE